MKLISLNKLFQFQIFVGVFFLISCDPFDTNIEKHIPNVNYYENKNVQEVKIPLDEIKIMSWNIKFGGGRIDFFYDCFGDRVLMSKEEVVSNLEGLAKKINQVNPDVLFLQETDIDSKRSTYIDQVQWILDHTAFKYATYASQWKADFVPSDGIGRMNSGNAILSKWKLTEAERIELPLVEAYDPARKYFYLRRNILKSKLVIGSKYIWLLNAHLEAYAPDQTKQIQINIFKTKLDEIKNKGELFVAGGDFNHVAPGTTILNGYSDLVCNDKDFPHDDYTTQTDWLSNYFRDFSSEIPLDEYKKNNAPYYTFTADKSGFWNRKIDHLFTNGNFVKGSGEVHQDLNSGGIATMSLSDHAPIIVKYKLNP